MVRDLDQVYVTTMRALATDAVQKAVAALPPRRPQHPIWAIVSIAKTRAIEARTLQGGAT